MHRTAAIITAATAALIAVAPSAVHADPIITASADCEYLDVDVAGLPDGTAVFVSEGQQPPFGFTVGTGPYWGFTPQPGGASAHIPIGAYERVHLFTWAVGTEEQPLMASGQVDCRPAVEPVTTEPAVVPVVEPVVVASEPPAPAEVRMEVWADVALSPPW